MVSFLMSLLTPKGLQLFYLPSQLFWFLIRPDSGKWPSLFIEPFIPEKKPFPSPSPYYDNLSFVADNNADFEHNGKFLPRSLSKFAFKIGSLKT